MHHHPVRRAILVPALLASGFACAAPRLAVEPDPARVAVERGIGVDAELGVPRLLWGAAARAPLNTSSLRKADELEASARRRLAEVAPLYRLEPAAHAAVETREVRAAGARLVRFGQRFGGLPVLERELGMVLDGTGGLILATGNLAPRAPVASFALDAPAAFARAWRIAVDPDPAAPPTLFATAAPREWTALSVAAASPGRWQLATGRVRQGWLQVGTELRPAFDFELTLRDGEGLTRPLAVKVDGATGADLGARSLLSVAAYSHRVWSQPGNPGVALAGPPGNTYLPHPTGSPDGSAASVTPRVLRAVDATPHRPTRPWFTAATGATSRDGHQVVAYADLDGGGDGTGGDLTAASTLAAFDYPFDPALDHGATPDQALATLTQAMYVANDIADWFHPAGFDEAGGNHQQSNFGLGGLGGDPLILETGDGDVQSNANASVPEDGASPRIQMGVYEYALSSTLGFTGSAGTAFERTGVDAGSATFGPGDYDLTDDLVVARDDAGPDPLDLCEPPSNAAELVGRIALVKRGNCFFVAKALTVQTAGAVGVVFDNHTPSGQPNGGVVNMSGGDPAVVIPAMSVSLEDGAVLRGAIASGESFTARLQRDAGPSVDTAADSSIVAHEWGHVLVNRNVIMPWPGCGNTGGPCMGPQPQGLNEGFADFVALLYLVDGSGHLQGYAGTYPVGGWAIGRVVEDGDYYGFRRYPYSTDLARNPLMFRHLAASATLPPEVPNGGPFDDPVEEHAVGEVWAVTLWDAYVGMLTSGRYTHAAARDRMREYLVAALKLMPDAPTFLEARDVFYGVVLARSREDHAEFTAAFAKRGMGQGAIGPSLHATDNGGIVESFLVEPTPAPPPEPEPPPEGGGGGESGGVAVLLLALAAARRALGRGAR